MQNKSYKDTRLEFMYRSGVSRPGTYQYSNYSSELEQYMSQLFEKYGNTPYWEELMANPYLRYPGAENGKYFDDYHFQNWIKESYPLAMQTIGGILQRANNTEYDSAVQAVGRERAAGINADIAGNVGPGESAPSSDIPSSDGILNPVEASLGKSSVAETIAGVGMNIASTVLNLVGGASSIIGQNINNAIGSVSALDETGELFYKRLIDATPIPQFKSAMTDSERVDAFKQALSVGFTQMDWNGIDRRSKKFYRNGFQNWLEGKGDSFGFEKRITKEYSDYLDNRDNIVKKVGNKIYSDNLDEMIGTYTSEIGDLAVDVQNIELNMRSRVAELEALKAGIDLDAYNIVKNDPNYVPQIAENLRQSPSVIGSDQSARIAEAGARTESANTTSVQQQIVREQKKAVKLVAKAFDKSISKVEKSKKFRSFKPYLIGSLKILKASTMSLTERWVDPKNPGLTEGALKAGQQAALGGM